MLERQPAEGVYKRLVIQPNASLAIGWALVFWGWMSLVSFTIAGLFAWRGFWMILPFAGLEMVALALGLYWSMRNNVYREVISVVGDRVVVEAGRHVPEQRWEFLKTWAQVQLEPGIYRNSPTRLSVRSHGRVCVLGRCLSDEEREQVAVRLRNWIRNAGQ